VIHRQACKCRMVECSEEKVKHLLRGTYRETEPGDPHPPSTGPPNAGYIRSASAAYFNRHIRHNRR
jgi:hypothetical protein